ncbi:hypothetical protein [Bradyrhizobium genosp. SA-3]|uniref:hypothetical protein n=1 Tax=Bradyrhizobium genosp. SA-3 TaxID=508868 RepID=UPI0013EE69B5|nr:hypothetical protein [Bradyrhizobium genosp. SA-3]
MTKAKDPVSYSLYDPTAPWNPFELVCFEHIAKFAVSPRAIGGRASVEFAD